MRALAPATECDCDALGHVVDPASSRPHDRVERWRVVALCGSGGTAEVWHAVAPDGREAALKRLSPQLRPRADWQQLLRREHALLRTAAHPCLVASLGLAEHDDGPELALEYLPNGDLVSLLGAEPRHWLLALRDVTGALTSLHERGVAHGDIKARNVLFAADHRARLIDLLMARPTDAPAVRGTPAYSLPAAYRATAQAADCFALAVLLYELVTARLPYGAEGARRVADWQPAAAPEGTAAARLLAAATSTLEAAGGPPRGLSYLADVIESVGAAGA